MLHNESISDRSFFPSDALTAPDLESACLSKMPTQSFQMLNTKGKYTYTALHNASDADNERTKIIENLYQGGFPTVNSMYSHHPGVWEYVIVLENPDNIHKDRPRFNLHEATHLFKKAFYVGDNTFDPILKMKYKLEKKIFINSFCKTYSLSSNLDTHSMGFLQAADLLTLMRNAILVKLAYNMKLHTRMVVSGDGKYIYILLATDEEVLENEAERMKYNIPLDIVMSDYLSLEPCDTKLRPLILLQQKNSNIRELIEKILPFYEEVLDSDVLLKISKDNTETSSKLEDDTVSDAQWSNYQVFLEKLYEGISKLPHEMPIELKKIYYRKVTKNTVKLINKDKTESEKLFTLWDRMKLQQALGANMDFITKSNNINDSYSNDIWKLTKISENGHYSKFRNTDRLKLIESLLIRHISVSDLKQLGIVIDAFPLINDWLRYGHTKLSYPLMNDYDSSHIQLLTEFESETKNWTLDHKWHTHLFSSQEPLTCIKNYFGEKIGLYFAFLLLFTKVLLVPGIIGMMIFILQLSVGIDTKPIIILNSIYCIFVCLWAVYFLEIWRRKEASLTLLWSQTDYETDEITRPQYKGETRRSPVTDDLNEEYYNPLKRMSFYVMGLAISVSIVIVVLGIVAALILLRWEITEDLTVGQLDFAGPVVSTINAIQIQVFNYIYSKVAVKLTDYENHKTQSAYEDSLILKTYLFEFVNSYNSIFYIAFIKTHFEGCIIDDGDNKVRVLGASCMNELYIQLGSLFLVFLLKNIIEIGLPLLKKKYRIRKTVGHLSHKKVKKNSSSYEMLRDKIDAEMTKESFTSSNVDGTIAEYKELAVLFGFIIIFAVAFPISFLLGFFMLVIEIKVDRYKLLNLVKRPQPIGAKNIGTWWSIFNFIVITALFTNPAIICFTQDSFQISGVSNSSVYLIYAGFVSMLIVLRAWLRAGIPDIPQKYSIIIKRHANVIHKILQGLRTEKISDLNLSNVDIDPFIYCNSDTPKTTRSDYRDKHPDEP